MDKLLALPSLWAILPDRINTIQHAYMAYLKGDNVRAENLPPVQEEEETDKKEEDGDEED